MKIVGLLVLAILSSGVSRSAELEEFQGVRLQQDGGWADGDSFMVVLTRNGKEESHVLRLYFVDAPETTAVIKTDKERVRAQSRYFGLTEITMALEFGRQAKDRVKVLLGGPFTVHTAFANALGRSKKPRIYGFVTLADGSDLAAKLVAEGLARAHGQSRTRPDGTKADEYKEQLVDLEVSAALDRRGVWAKSDAEKIRELRAKEREEAAELDAAFEHGLFAPFGEGNLLNINSATMEELQELKGIGPKLAEAIIDGRPYAKVTEITRVKGIGKGTLAAMREFLTVE
ncbi:MAG: helix-hairpin-helix domain-containing protein [Verrucomicrobia bacterium]|nr:helix-hairpin-helix domain-containing protein [Verrucomicrobiota bacterium]